MSDPIDQFLGADFSGRSPSGLRQALLDATTRGLRRRRHWRRLALAGALAACFVAGMGAMTLWRSLEAPDQQANQTRDVPAAEPQVAKAAPPTVPQAPPSLVDMEWRAFDSRENRAALFFEVARRYLDERQDYDSALRCYRQALDAAAQEDLAIRPDDNWLVMALKESRQKENNDAYGNP